MKKLNMYFKGKHETVDGQEKSEANRRKNETFNDFPSLRSYRRFNSIGKVDIFSEGRIASKQRLYDGLIYPSLGDYVFMQWHGARLFEPNRLQPPSKHTQKTKWIDEK
jgi:hypothetical protein